MSASTINNNTFMGATPNSNTSSGTQIAMSREMQEIQARLIMSKHCPRDQINAFNSIMQACQRKSLAEQACYSYPKGKTTVSGASIRLAEVLAQSWGNIDFGIREIERRIGVSVCESFAWDMESNTRNQRRFEVKHIRDTSNGGKKLTSERDIYEVVMSQGARRLRACILSIIPGDLTEEAIKKCNKTLSDGYTEPLQDRVRKMVVAFCEFGVSQGMLEKRLGHVLTTINEGEFVNLKAIYTSLRDNFANAEDYFDTMPEPNITSEQALAALDIAQKTQKLAPEDISKENTEDMPEKAPTKKEKLLKACLKISCDTPELVKDYLKQESVDGIDKLSIKQLEALVFISKGKEA